MVTPRKSAKQASRAEVLDEDLPEPIGEEYTPEDVQIASLLAELGDEGVSVRIYREGPQGYRDLTFIDEVGVADFSPKMLKGDPYNGGTFRIHAQGPEGGLRVNRRLKVEPGPRNVPTLQPQQSGLAGMSPEQFALMMANIMKSAMPAPVDPMVQMKGVIDVLAPLLAVSSRPTALPVEAPKAKTLMESLTEYKLLKDLFSDGGGSGETPLMEKLALKGVDFFTMAAQQRAASVPAPGTPALSAPAPADVQPEFTPEQEEELILARIAMRRACAAAIAKKSAKEFAADNYDDVPEGLLVTISCAPDWFEQLCAFYPDAAPHREWFDLVRLELIQFGVEDGLLTKQANGSITPNIGKGELNQDAISVPASAPVISEQPAAAIGGKPAD